MVGLFNFLLVNRARQASREREAADAAKARLTAALNAVPAEFVEYDSDRRQVMANQAARDASAWRVPGAGDGKTIDELMAAYATHFEDLATAQVWKEWADKSIGDFDRGGVADSCRPDGQWRRSYVSDMPGGGHVVIRVDITEEKRREEEQSAEMERLNSVFQSTGVGIVVLDHDARVVLANQVALDIHGRTAAKMVGQAYADLTVAGLDPATIRKWQAASGPTRFRAVKFESVAGTGDTKKVIRVTANPVQDAAGNLRYIVLIGVDDTERRLAEIRMFDSARLAHVGEMATGMAHELNQPLAIIRMAIESLTEELDAPKAAVMPVSLDEVVRSKLDRISKQVERASGLVRSLRAVAQKPTNVPVPFDLVKAVRVSGDLIREQLKAARIDFQLDLPPSAPTVRGEANQLQQVLISLVMNARDALADDPGRPLTGTLGHINVRLVAAQATGAMEITVEDNGPGIPVANLPRLFEPFFTTKPTGKGIGLGLSVSHGIIKRMGGVITAENRPEGGACFRIAFAPSSTDGNEQSFIEGSAARMGRPVAARG
jgi:PAS domain S-box-containing protein